MFIVGSENVPLECVVDKEMRTSGNDTKVIEINKKVEIKGYFPCSFGKLRAQDGIGYQIIR